MSGVAGLWQEVNNRKTHFYLIGSSPFKPASYPQDGEAEFDPSVCTLSKLLCAGNFAHRNNSLCASADLAAMSRYETSVIGFKSQCLCCIQSHFTAKRHSSAVHVHQNKPTPCMSTPSLSLASSGVSSSLLLVYGQGLGSGTGPGH